MSIEESDRKINESVFLVEATNTEHYYLWKENKYETENIKHEWIQDNLGFSIIIGELEINSEKWPVVVGFRFAFIGGHRVCFYNATSRFVDHDMIEKYLEANYPKTYQDGNRRAMTDASNFHNVYHHIESLNK